MRSVNSGLVLSRPVFLALLLAGSVARLASLPSPGTEDVGDFGIWMHDAVVHGITQVYGGPTSAVLRYDGSTSIADYPPVAYYELAAAGHVYLDTGGRFRGLWSLIMPVKLLALTGATAVALLLWFTTRGLWGVAQARLATAAFWANPAIVLHSSALGYLDMLACLPAMAALVAANAEYAWLSGVLLSIGVLTKPQGIFVAPAILVALLRTRRGARERLATFFAGTTTAAAIIVLPFLGAGTLRAMMRGLTSLVTDGTLSAQAANVWWLLAYGIRVTRRFAIVGAPAFFVQSRILQLSDVLTVHSPVAFASGARIVAAGGWSCVALLVAWAAWRARAHNDFTTTVALAAFTVHAYFMFAVQVHENHMIFALPLLALIVGDRASYRRLFVVLSAIVLLNLYLFYGFDGQSGASAPRAAALVDATVLLAAANLAAFVWHGCLFAALCDDQTTVAVRATPSDAAAQIC